jgi:predicted metal-dependent phosphoesterase TrpH
MEKPDVRKIILTPELDGFVTLAGDFHTHTIFSDGSVWPVNRIEEAWRDGLDVIAITDHDRYKPNAEYLKSDNHTSVSIATSRAGELDILLVPAIEITRKMPPGHFNALFVADANLEELNDTSRAAFMTAVEKLTGQGALIVWNHPGWIAQQKDTVKWFEIHQTLLEKRMLHGVEVFNYMEWYPIALDWCLTKGLAPFANSDIHEPIQWAYGQDPGFIRPMTLIFAKEKSLTGVRDAVLQKRTVAWFNGQLAGDPDMLEKIFQRSVRVGKMNTTNGKTRYLLSNQFDIPLHIKGLSEEWTKEVVLPARSESVIIVPEQVNSLDITVLNFHSGMKENLSTLLKLN